jgi:CheY-like chemotaxis protein
MGTTHNAAKHRAVAEMPIDIVQFLVVDDYPLVRRIVGECLKGCGVKKFHSAQNGAEALDFLRRRSPIVKDSAVVDMMRDRPDIVADLSPETADFGSAHWHCVITDFSMPRGTGLDVLKAIRCGETNVPRDTPVILLTGYSDDFVIAAALELDVSAFIIKPVSRNSLEDRLKRVLTGTFKPKRVGVYAAVELPNEQGEVASGKKTAEAAPALPEPDPTMRWLPVATIQPGAVLAKDLRTERGALLMQCGTALSHFVLKKLMELHRSGGFDGVFAVKNETVSV